MKPRLSFWRIVEMNLGFFGLQFSFGLQQANMSPIYGYLGASEATMPLLWLAGPVTGLIVQPLIGAISDRTRPSLGRRAPWILAGALICSACLLAMPYSSTLWMAASLLWILDAANNVTMEPYRAYVADRLAGRQYALGYLTQSAVTGLAQTLAYLVPSLLASHFDRSALGANGVPAEIRAAFAIGAVLSLATVAYSMLRVPELAIAPLGKPVPPRPAARAVLREIGLAVKSMPRPVRRMAPAMICQWYAMFVYWQYVAYALARSLHGNSEPHSPAFRAAVLTAQQLGALYNLLAFIAALGLVPVARRYGARHTHAVCLTAAGFAMIALPQITSPSLLALPMLGIGLGWASMMGNTYVMLAAAIPPERTGVYMGLFNILIAAPMLLETVTLPLIYGPLLGHDPRHALALAGALLLLGALATLLLGPCRFPVKSHPRGPSAATDKALPNRQPS